MEIRLDNKVMLVTGATQGIGRAIAETLAHSGAGGLLISGREPTRGNAVAAELSQAGTPTIFVAADLSDPEAPALLAAECVSRFGRIDGLVNAAGLTDRASFVDASLDDWASLFAVNARAPFFLMQAAIADMIKRGERGAIVNILSINAHCGSPELAVYSATKGALATLTKNAANAHRFDRIRVNGINVGWTDTPAERIMQAETLGKGPGWLDTANAAQPFGRLLTPNDIASLAVFLLSDAAGPMTGAVIDQEQSVIGANR